MGHTLVGLDWINKMGGCYAHLELIRDPVVQTQPGQVIQTVPGGLARHKFPFKHALAASWLL